MRSFIITAFLFLFMLSLIFFNKMYIESSADYIIECMSDEMFSENPEEASKALDNFWNKNISTIGLSVGYKELDRMSELIVNLKENVVCGNLDEAKHTRALIIESASDIARLEQFSLENIF